jgi:hypothetical protein
VANVLKDYFRALPEPLLPFSKYDEFIAIASKFAIAATSKPTTNKHSHCFITTEIPKEGEVIVKLKEILKTLPMTIRITFKYLIHFIQTVSKHVHMNFMTTANLAIVFAPNLLYPPGNDMIRLMSDSGHTSRLFQIFIRSYDEIFSVGHFTFLSILSFHILTPL